MSRTQLRPSLRWPLLAMILVAGCSAPDDTITTAVEGLSVGDTLPGCAGVAPPVNPIARVLPNAQVVVYDGEQPLCTDVRAQVESQFGRLLDRGASNPMPGRSGPQPPPTPPPVPPMGPAGTPGGAPNAPLTAGSAEGSSNPMPGSATDTGGSNPMPGYAR